MNKKYAVWIKGNKDATKEYVYAPSHHDAVTKYNKNHHVDTANIETQKA